MSRFIQKRRRVNNMCFHKIRHVNFYKWLINLTIGGIIFFSMGNMALADETGPSRARGGIYMGQKSIILENSYVRVIILPCLGGRIIEYTLKKTGHNQFAVYSDNFSKPQKGWVDYGGMEDSVFTDGKPGWPGDFWRKKYDYSLTDSKARLTVQESNIQIDKIVYLEPDTTRLKMFIQYTNIGKTSLNTFIKPHPELTVGGEADSSDYLLIPASNSAIRKIRCVEGNGGSNYFLTDRSWWACIDNKNKEMLLLTYDREQVKNLYAWIGDNAYNMEYEGVPVLLEPSESIKLDFDFWILNSKEDIESLRKKKLFIHNKNKQEMVSQLSLIWQEDLSKLSGLIKIRKNKVVKKEKILFSFVQVTDTHLLDSNPDPYIVQLADEIKEFTPSPKFVIHTGDLVDLPLEGSFLGVKNSFRPFNLLVKFVVGNHDIGQQSHGATVFTKELYKKHFGKLNYTFNVGPYLFIVLDTTTLESSEKFPGYESKVDEENIQWLKERLKKISPDAPLIIFTHYPLYEHRCPAIAANGREILDLFKSYNLIAVISGHRHQSILTERDGVINISTKNLAAHATGMSEISPYYRIVYVYKDHIVSQTRRLKVR